MVRSASTPARAPAAARRARRIAAGSSPRPREAFAEHGLEATRGGDRAPRRRRRGHALPALPDARPRSSRRSSRRTSTASPRPRRRRSRPTTRGRACSATSSTSSGCRRRTAGFSAIMAPHLRAEQLLGRARTRLTPAREELIARAQAAGDAAPDSPTRTSPCSSGRRGRVVDATRDIAPEFWRRYLALALDGLRAGGATPLPQPPLTRGRARSRDARLHGAPAPRGVQLTSGGRPTGSSRSASSRSCSASLAASRRSSCSSVMWREPVGEDAEVARARRRELGLALGGQLDDDDPAGRRGSLRPATSRSASSRWMIRVSVGCAVPSLSARRLIVSGPSSSVASTLVIPRGSSPRACRQSSRPSRPFRCGSGRATSRSPAAGALPETHALTMLFEAHVDPRRRPPSPSRCSASPAAAYAISQTMLIPSLPELEASLRRSPSERRAP